MSGICQVLGDVDAESAPHIATQLREEIDRATVAVVVADCSGVTFMGSAGFRLFVDATAYASARGHTLVIRNMSPPCTRLFALCQATNLLSIDAKAVSCDTGGLSSTQPRMSAVVLKAVG